MSAFLAIGNFLLTNGQRISKPRTSGNPIYYMIYDSGIMLKDEPQTPDLAVEIRVYCSSDEIILQNGTVVSLIAKCSAPGRGQKILLEVLSGMFWPFPGNPADTSQYEKHIPDNVYTVLIPLGTVVSASPRTASGAPGPFDMEVQDYVRDNNARSTINVKFNPTNLRWRNGPTINPNVSVQALGFCTHLSETGTLGLTAEHLALGGGGRGGLGATPSNSPNRPSKFARAFATTGRVSQGAQQSIGSSTSTMQSTSRALSPPTVEDEPLPSDFPPSASTDSPVTPLKNNPTTVDSFSSHLPSTHRAHSLFPSSSDAAFGNFTIAGTSSAAAYSTAEDRHSQPPPKRASASSGSSSPIDNPDNTPLPASGGMAMAENPDIPTEQAKGKKRRVGRK